MKILLYTKFKDIVAVATFKMLVATCGDWRQGWTTLIYIEQRTIKEL